MQVKKIKIAIDCRDLQIAKTGSKTYLSEILTAISALNFHDVEFVEIHPNRKIEFSNSILGKLKKHISFIYWKNISLPLKAKALQADVLICTDYFLPICNFGMRRVVIFHDAFFWEYPSHYNPFWLKLFYHWAVPLAKKADVILVPSYYVQKRLNEWMKLPLEKYRVVYEAPKTIINAKSQSSVSVRFENHKKYLLHVGSLSKHKNLPFLIRAFKKATKEDCQDWELLLVGSAPSSIADNDAVSIINTIAEEEMQDKIHLIGFVPDELLYSYYTNASGYVFPSYNEGFGLPVLEAMKFHLPIIASNNTCLPEIAQNAAIYFDPYNMNDLVQALSKLMNRDNEVNMSVSNQSAVLNRYSWSKSVLEITEICKAVI